MELASIFKKAYWSLAVAGLLYVLSIFSLTFPVVQRGALYSHKINPSKFYDLDNVESYGFSKSQVQPFNLTTPDGATLYAWHVLPPHLCHEHEASLLESATYGPAPDITKTTPFKLLAEDPNARVIVNLHGNAADLGTGFRPKIYRNFVSTSTPSRPVHVIAFDYRGFGKSTGSPTEEGLITDALTVVNYLTSPPLSISPKRIVIAGQSLGTAVAAGLAEKYTFDKATSPSLREPFAGIFLFAPFTNLPQLLNSFSVMGIFPPILSPLLQYPSFQKYVVDNIVDRWDTAARLARLAGVSPKSDADKSTDHGGQDFDLTILHAVNDFDIPWREGKAVWEHATGGKDTKRFGSLSVNTTSEDGTLESKVWERTTGSGKQTKRIGWERVRYGGHNEIATLSPATVAILRVLDKPIN